MSVSPIASNLPTTSCPPSAMHGGVSLQDPTSDTEDPPSITPSLSLPLTPGSFLGLEARQVQGLQACRVKFPTPVKWNRSSVSRSEVT